MKRLERVIRRMTEADINAVAELEQMCFTVPWSRYAFEQEITHNCLARYYVVTMGERVVAYGGFWLVFDEAHITNIAVHPRYRKRGIGKELLKSLIQLAADSGVSKMYLECRISNEAAQRLYFSQGFEIYGIRKRYYEDNKEDALNMELSKLPEGNPENDPWLVRE